MLNIQYQRGKGTRAIIGLIRTIGERFLEEDKDVYAVLLTSMLFVSSKQYVLRKVNRNNFQS